MVNGRKFNLIERMDSWNNIDEDFSVDYWNRLDIERAASDESMYVKKRVPNNSIRILGNWYMENGRNLNPSEQKDSQEYNDQDCIVNYWNRLDIERADSDRCMM